MPFLKNADGSEQLIIPSGNATALARMGATAGDFAFNTDTKAVQFDDGQTPGGVALGTAMQLLDVAKPSLDAAKSQADRAKAIVDGLGVTETGWPRGAHRYWRLDITEYDIPLHITDFQMRAVPGGPNLATGGTAFASASEKPPSQAFDGLDSTEWISNGGLTIGYDYGAGNAVSVNEFAIKANTGTAPRAGILRWSDDGVTYTDAIAVVHQTAWVNAETRTFTDPQYGNASKRLLLEPPADGLSYSRSYGSWNPIATPDGTASTLTPFQATMLPAMRGGFIPSRTPPASPPATSQTMYGSYGPPAGQALVRADSQGTFRTRGGDKLLTDIGGQSSILRLVSLTPFGNGDAQRVCNRAIFEFDYTGSYIAAILQGHNTRYRWIVDGCRVSTAVARTSNDGGFNACALDFGGVYKTRRIVLETDNAYLYGFFTGTNDVMSAPTEVLPRIVVPGSSLDERAFGSMLPFMYRNGVDVYGAAVGSSNMLQSGTGGRAKMINRSIDYTGVQVDAAFHVALINDVGGVGPDGVWHLPDNNTGAELYGAGTFAAVEQIVHDECRRNLNAFFSAQASGVPWIAMGYWPTKSIPDPLWAIDAGYRRAVEEYPLAFYDDAFTTRGYMWPVNSDANAQAYYQSLPGSALFGDDATEGTLGDGAHVNEQNGAQILAALETDVLTRVVASGCY